jgi:WD40 repeat protein
VDDGSYRLLQQLNTGGLNQEVRSVCISPDGQVVVAGTVGGTILKWNLSQGKSLPEVVKAHAGIINQIVFSPNKDTFVSAGSDGFLKVWNLLSLQAPPVSHHLQSPVLALALSEQTRLLAEGTHGGTVALFNTSRLSDDPVRFKADASPVQAVAFSPAGGHLATGHAAGSVKLWEASGLHKRPVELIGHRSGINAIRFSPDQKTFATCSYDNTIRIWTLGALNENPVLIEDNDS